MFRYEDNSLVNLPAELKPCDVEIKLTQVQHYKMEYDYPETAVDLTKHFTGPYARGI